MSDWENEFRNRVDAFEAALGKKPEGRPVSIKVRVSSGCFHREHSPAAYVMIDEYLRSHPDLKHELRFMEHESGPEIFTFATAGVLFGTAVIQLITEIIRARANGIRAGDRPRDPVEVICRDFGRHGNLRQETLIRFRPEDPVDYDTVKAVLDKHMRGRTDD